jgi:pimeloyl-ACP methyl ester carboxylesterase
MKILKILIVLAIAFTFSSNFLRKEKYIEYSVIGQGKPLVLIHPFPSDSEIYKPQQEGLSDTFQIILINLYGFGKSEDTDGSLVLMSEYADQIAIVLDKLDLKNAIIGGESMGGYVALAFLDKYPQRVAGLVLSNTNSLAEKPEGHAKRQAAIDQILRDGPTQYVLDFLPKALSKNASEEAVEFLKQILLRQRTNGMVSAIRSMDTRNDTTEALKKTETPVLVITSELDIVVNPVETSDMAKIAKNSRLVTIPKTGHLTSLEQPQIWNDAIRDYFY